RNSECNFHNKEHKNAMDISVFFNQDVLKKALIEIPEAYAILRLIEFSIYGIRVSDNEQDTITEKLNSLTNKNSFGRFLGLLEILECSSRDNKANFISPLGIPIHPIQESIPKI